jgi:hypothetical protein
MSEPAATVGGMIDLGSIAGLHDGRCALPPPRGAWPDPAFGVATHADRSMVMRGGSNGGPS